SFSPSQRLEVLQRRRRPATGGALGRFSLSFSLGRPWLIATLQESAPTRPSTCHNTCPKRPGPLSSSSCSLTLWNAWEPGSPGLKTSSLILSLMVWTGRTLLDEFIFVRTSAGDVSLYFIRCSYEKTKTLDL
ncbi:unnamed protein product, partial [Ranitomeya imitator]